ncbi:MAG: hypothetical protein ACFE0I_03340 [Elainellaceae cyanobacterium]
MVHRLVGVLNHALGNELQLPERRPAKLKDALLALDERSSLMEQCARSITHTISDSV